MQDVKFTIETLRGLGFAVNERKSVVSPTQNITHLGFHIDTIAMEVTLSPNKLEKLKQRAEPLMAGSPTIRQVMRFIGAVESCIIGMKHGRLHKHRLERCKNKAIALHKGKGNLMNTCCYLEQHWERQNGGFNMTMRTQD